MNPYTNVVARGADLLDTLGPRDWRDRIEDDRLNMGDCEWCILGQVYQIYSQAKEALFGTRFVTYAKMAEHGFDVDPPTDNEPLSWYTANYKLLADAWLELLTAKAA